MTDQAPELLRVKNAIDAAFSEKGLWIDWRLRDAVAAKIYDTRPPSERPVAQVREACNERFLEQAHRDSDWIGLSASEKACYDWPDDTDLHKQCRAAYIAGATDYARAALTAERPAQMREDESRPSIVERESIEHIRRGLPAGEKMMASDVQNLLRAFDRLQVVALTAERPEAAVAWPNGCDKTVPRALRYLAEHNRPTGGQQKFNSEHLYQLADEIEKMAAQPLYAIPHEEPGRETMTSVQANKGD